MGKWFWVNGEAIGARDKLGNIHRIPSVRALHAAVEPCQFKRRFL
uniref:Uncharacterized protein n=1 Tax=Anguilla anguilla TaxID=7936 RepID=A0A0E9P729_ANGAN